MKTITVKQPWASLIVHGIKDIENRTWKTKYRGRVLIHAGVNRQKGIFDPDSGVMTDEQWEAIGEKWRVECVLPDSPTGAIIGSAEIVDCIVSHPSIWAEKTEVFTDEDGFPTYKDKIYNWVLANPILFPEPIPAKGRLSFWDYPNILAEPEEKDGELFCHCQLPVKEENQVWSMIDHYRCHYCGGRWYK